VDRELLDEQISYYRARASEYDEWFFRLGRYGRVLELACGTGLWTRRLAELAAEVTALDATPEVLQINRRSRVSPSSFESFWCKVRAALKPGGSAFFVDNARNAQIAARDHRLPEADDFVMNRELNDGRRFRVVKVFYEPPVLEQRLGALGWQGYVRSPGEFFIYGCVQARQPLFGTTAKPGW